MIRAGGTDADAVVIGAGFFGCHVALQLRGIGMDRVILEADPERERSELSKLFNDDEPGRA